MLEYRFRLVGFDTLRHHIIDVHDDGGAELEVVLTLDALLCDGLGRALGVPPFELPCQQVAEPPLKEGNDASYKEEPYSPAWSPKTYTRAAANLSSVEPVVYQMLEVLRHPYLPHESVLITIHACKVTNMCEDVLEPIC